VTSPDLAPLVLAIVALEPQLHPQHVKEALPAALAALKAVCASKAKPVLPEPAQRDPIPSPWGGHHG
jgi:hypothetical protein